MNATEEIAATDVGWLVINRGLDRTWSEAWDWYREVRSNGDHAPVLREHLLVISNGCDDIVRRLFPKQVPWYRRESERRIDRLEQSLENSALR